MSIFKVVFGLSAILVINNAAASVGWYVSIQNNTATDLAINFGGNDNWYCNDFCGPQQVKAGVSKTFYTEQGLMAGNPAVQGINLSGPYDAHVEFWTAVPVGNNDWKEHPHSVTYNIRKSSLDWRELVFIGTNSPYVSTLETANPDDGFYGTVYANIFVNEPSLMQENAF
jgi:hypothetical protein